MILVSTVWHSGTHSLVDWLDVEPQEIKWLHCCPEAVQLAQSDDYRCITTYRNPRDIAISWARRGDFRPDVWREQWSSYRDIIPFAEVIPVTRFEKRLGSYDKQGDFKPPESEIEFAFECIKNLPLDCSG